MATMAAPRMRMARKIRERSERLAAVMPMTPMRKKGSPRAALVARRVMTFIAWSGSIGILFAFAIASGL